MLCHERLNSRTQGVLRLVFFRRDSYLQLVVSFFTPDFCPSLSDFWT